MAKKKTFWDSLVNAGKTVVQKTQDKKKEEQIRSDRQQIRERKVAQTRDQAYRNNPNKKINTSSSKNTTNAPGQNKGKNISFHDTRNGAISGKDWLKSNNKQNRTNDYVHSALQSAGKKDDRDSRSRKKYEERTKHTYAKNEEEHHNWSDSTDVGADREFLSDEDYKTIQHYKKEWEKARERGDTSGMETAHNLAEELRKKYGYIGGTNGGAYNMVREIESDKDVVRRVKEAEIAQLTLEQDLKRLEQEGKRGTKSAKSRAKASEGKTPPLEEGQPENVPMKTVRVERNFGAEQAALDNLVKACPTLAQGLDNGHWFSGDLEEVLTLLEELRKSGVEHSLEWPKGMRLKLKGQLDATSIKARIGWTSNDWFGISGTAQLDDNEMIPLTGLLNSLKGSRFVSLGDGEYVALTADLRRKLSSLKLVTSETKKGDYQVNALASAAVEQALADMEVEVDPKWENNVERMHRAFATTPAVPSLLRADLREYQREGYEWMQRLAIWGVGACLADDMGLGKTVQSIAVLLNQAAHGPCLVVAPTSVCGNWDLEIGRFAPSLNVVRFGHTGREATVKALGPNDVLVMGYGLLPNVQPLLAKVQWSMVIFDEAQALKNAATKRAKAGKKIQADFRLALTGTPIENSIDDLWSLFNIINPGLLGSWENFTHRYGQAATPGTPASKALRAVVRPFLLRRLKSSVLDELPEKTEQNIIVEPNPKELAFYETLRRRAVEKLHSSESSSGAKRIEILAELTRLRRACCHPGLADPDMMKLEKYSSKTLTFLETVQDLIQSGHKVLAFSQFTTYLALIREALEEKGISFQYLDGQTPELERKKRVAAFQSGQGDVFLLSLKAGGTGLNLTAADYVIHLDPWWNPAVEDQASDRAHRIGQKRPVTIYRMVQQGSVEEKILALHQSKRELAADFLEGTETSVKSLTEEDLLRLLQ